MDLKVLLEPYQDSLAEKYWGNSLENYIIALAIFIGLSIIFRIFRYVILHRLKQLAQKTITRFDDALVEAFEKAHPKFYDAVALYFALHSLKAHNDFDKAIDGILLAIIIIQVIASSKPIIDYLLHKVVKDNQSDQTDQTAFHAISILVQVALWTTGVLLFLSNLGFNITSLAASLGIGGIAVALAVQNILGDLFSSLSIYLDKPFVVGDFIIVDDTMGTVEKIGLKTTRLRALQGEEIVIANKELTSSRIQNFKKMQKRRVAFDIGVTYDTSLEKCKEIPSLLENAFNAVEQMELDRATFREFADSSLTYEIVYYHQSGDYKEYMESRQNLNFKIKEEFDKAGIDMAFPTQTLHVETMPAK